MKRKEKVCPKCYEEGDVVWMEFKFSLDDAVDDFSATKVFQCPECKNIETL